MISKANTTVADVLPAEDKGELHFGSFTAIADWFCASKVRVLGLVQKSTPTGNDL
jgi:hypothetical protein